MPGAGAGNIDLAKSIRDKASKKCLVIEDLEPLERPEKLSVADVDSLINGGGLLTTGQPAGVVSRLLGCSSDAARNLATYINSEQAKVRLVEQQGRVCVHKYAAWRGAPARKCSQFKICLRQLHGTVQKRSHICQGKLDCTGSSQRPPNNC